MESVCSLTYTEMYFMRDCKFRPYSREEAVYPLPYLKERKFWPTVGRIDDGKFFPPSYQWNVY